MIEVTLDDKDLQCLKELAIKEWFKLKYNPYESDDRMDMTLCYIRAMSSLLKEKGLLTIDVGGTNGTNK